MQPTTKNIPTIHQAIRTIAKELAYKKHYTAKEIQKHPSKKERLATEVQAMELGLAVLKEVRDKQGFLKLDTLKG